MGVFARLSDLITANVHALLDRAEDPEVLIAQVLRDLEEGLAATRGHAATAIAAERRLARELEQGRIAAEQWKGRARRALAAEREDLARRALARKQEQEEQVDRLEAQHAAASRASDDARAALRTLEARLAEARQTQRLLVARHRAVLARRGVCRLRALPLPAERLQELECRLRELDDRLTAEAELLQVDGGLEGELGNLERRDLVEQELAELKRELGRG